MANYLTGQDLVNGVLEISGELTDGTSGYQDDALTYLNLAYKGVLTGGNIYGIDVADPWPFALAKRPIILMLQPAILNVAISTTQFSYDISFSQPPVDVIGNTISVEGYWFNIFGRDEWFRVAQHSAGSPTAQMDSPYTESDQNGASCTIVKLDYDLIDDSILVDSSNNKIDFGDTITRVATLTNGIYTPTAYAGMVGAALTTSSGVLTYTGSWDPVRRLFTWAANGVFSILNASGVNAPISASKEMGLERLDYTNMNSYVATYPLNAINRLTAPMITYRKSSDAAARYARNEGKIFELSFNTFVREYPLTLMNSGTPDKFCVTKKSDTGIVSVRFNSYFYNQPTRVEVAYIPKIQDLQNNAASIPVLPEEHRKYLVDAAAAMLLHDKVDSRKSEREMIAKAGLQALLHSNRKDSSLAGINYGKLVPRPLRTASRGWWWGSSN